MRNCLLLSIGLALAGGQARAQVFRPGWVLLTQGDTLRGQVEDAAWEEAPRQVRFRAGAGAAISTYAVPDIQAFRLQGGRYFRYETLPLDREAQKELFYLTTSLKRNPQPETFLAEVLVDGPASLLRTAVDNVQHYYVRREGRPVLELAERNYIREQEGRRVIADGNNYRSELLAYFGDCSAAADAIGAFQAPALVAVVQAYNRQCAAPLRAGTEYRPASHRLIGGFALGLVAGGRYNSCQLQAEPASATATLNGNNLGGGIQPLGGIFADILAPGRHFALHLTGLLTRIGRREQLATPSQGLVARLDNQVTLLEFRLGGRYFWSSTRQGQRFFVGSGFSLPAAVSSHDATLLYYGAGSQQIINGSYVPDAYPFGLLPYLEAGVQHGRFTLALDGRMQARDTYGIASYSPQPQAGPQYSFSYESYSARVWYLGATLGVALWQVR
jgi:hypothetical protein